MDADWSAFGITHRLVLSMNPYGYRWAFFDAGGREIPGGLHGASMLAWARVTGRA